MRVERGVWGWVLRMYIFEDGGRWVGGWKHGERQREARGGPTHFWCVLRVARVCVLSGRLGFGRDTHTDRRSRGDKPRREMGGNDDDEEECVSLCVMGKGRERTRTRKQRERRALTGYIVVRQWASAAPSQQRKSEPGIGMKEEEKQEQALSFGDIHTPPHTRGEGNGKHPKDRRKPDETKRNQAICVCNFPLRARLFFYCYCSKRMK